MKTQNDCTQNPKEEGKELSPLTYRLIYGFFLLLTLWFVVLGDYALACTQLGMALVFDPFDQKQPFGERPFWQRAWLILHLVGLMALFGLVLRQL